MATFLGGGGGTRKALQESGEFGFRRLALSAGEEVPNAGGFIRSFVTKEDQFFYRVSSGAQDSVGGFLTSVRPKSSAYAREALALPGINDASLIQTVLVPAGTRLQRSRALPAFGRRGGAEQFRLLNNIPAENFGFRMNFSF
jgi:hypothetical protein